MSGPSRILARLLFARAAFFGRSFHASGRARAVLARQSRGAGRDAGCRLPLPAHDGAPALDSYNTGVQTGGYTSPLRRPETLDISPEDAATLGVADGDTLRISSRRGSVVAPVRIDKSLRAGLVFMTLHFQDEVRVNVLTTGRVGCQIGRVRVQGVRGSSRAGHGGRRRRRGQRPRAGTRRLMPEPGERWISA